MTITRKVTETDLPLSLSLVVLGLNGITAYFAVLEVGQPQPGDTVVVSTAAGTFDIDGGAAKTRICREEFGYDAAIDYKAADGLGAAISAECPDGIGVCFDNTSGPISAAVLARLAAWVRARSLCSRGDVIDGIEQAPGAIAGLYRDDNLGKRLIRLDHARNLAAPTRHGHSHHRWRSRKPSNASLNAAGLSILGR